MGGSELKWTHEKPSTPGWYWYRDKPGREEIYHLTMNTGPFPELVINCGDDGFLFPIFMDGEFAGPIAVPN